jgi:hypothetical protein
MINDMVLSYAYISTWIMFLFAFVFASSGLISTQMGSLPVAFGQTAGGNATGGSQATNVTHGGGPGAGATTQSEK